MVAYRKILDSRAMESTNFIPLGDRKANPSSDGRRDLERSAPIAEQTKEEKQRIARENRLSLKKEKKKIKSDAKKQRKENAVMHRRLTRNNEKYIKNRERNKLRDVEIERNKIRHAAVRQAENLAGKHDLSGKLFNVGEVIIMPDGQVKSVEALQRIAGLKTQRAAERKAREERKAAAELAGKSIKQGKLPLTSTTTSTTLEGVNPQRQDLIESLKSMANPAHHPRISNRQRRKQELLNPRIAPPKPFLPEGYFLPKGEENFIALWDITDEEIQKRLYDAKKRKERERKALRDEQQVQKRFNKAMKALRKEAARKGVLFDPEEAKRKVLGEEERKKLADESSHSDSGSSSDSISKSSSNSHSDSDSELKSESSSPPQSKPDSSSGSDSEDVDQRRSKKQKRSDEIDTVDLPTKKMRLVTVEPASAGRANGKTGSSKSKQEILRELLDPNYIENRVKKEQQRVVREQKRKEKLAAKAEKQYVGSKPSNMRKRARDDADLVKDIAVDLESDVLAGASNEPRKKKQKKNDAVDKDYTVASTFDSAEPEKKKHKKVQIEERSAVTENAEPANKKSKKKAKIERHMYSETPDNAELEQNMFKKKSTLEMQESASTSHNTVGEQWNTQALIGDEARKAKFLRLLGARKTGDDSSKKHKSSKKVIDILKVQSDLERQYEAGIKLKHDGGSKRRGLGS
ncbi:small acidic protein family-domain-containing protein [Bisporella sp. PMI_857]|nr:small acidic protein family-domain-containing protein [Bisporella sp. PMI_857]